MYTVEVWGFDKGGLYVCIKRKTFETDQKEEQEGFVEIWSKRMDKQGNPYDVEVYEE